MELFKNTKIDFLGKQKYFIGLSLLLIAIGVGSWASKGGLKYGIDFTGGANITVRFASRPPIDRVRAAVSARIPGEISVQEVTGENELIIGLPLKEDVALQRERQTVVDTLNETFGEKTDRLDLNNTNAQALAERLREPFQRAAIPMNDEQILALARRILDYKNSPPRSGVLSSFDQLREVEGLTPQMLEVIRQQCYLAPFTIRSAEVIGPKIGAEMRNKAVLAVLYALGGMLVYLALRFEFVYGLAAVIAVFHDVIITLGFFSLTDKEISLNVVAALLTLVGYSMNDTIVVFDRIRETLKLSRRELTPAIVNDSINQTLSRTVLTSGLTLISALALWLFGGPVLNGFAFALVVGVIVGTYSSIFIASPILVFWHERLRKGKRASAPAAAK